MRRTIWTGWLAALAVVALAGCGELAFERSRVLLWWESQEMLFALSPQRGRVDAYRLHGGVLWTGGLDLPAGECFDALRFDPDSARLWVFGEEGGLLVDARHMRELARWRGALPQQAPPPHALASEADSMASERCAARALVRDDALASGRLRQL